jgi:hypothetical protein
VLEGDYVDETHPLWNASTSCVIPRKAQEMASWVALLLQSCHEVLLIDPYFRPSDIRHRRPLEAFLAAVIEKRQIAPLMRVEIHTGDHASADYFRGECERCLPSIVPEGMRVRVIRWRQRDGGDLPHNRYILTDVGGVSFGVGLDNGTDGEADEATLLEEKTYQIRWVQLAGPEPVFEFVDELMIEGIRGLQVP